MARLMSVAFTEQAVIERRKTVTRRKGWWEDRNGRRLIKPGDHLTLCRKVMGRKPGEQLVRLAEVQVVDVRREPLYLCVADWNREGPAEGFPDLTAQEFMRQFFVDAQGMATDDDVTRIEWRYLDECPCLPGAPSHDCCEGGYDPNEPIECRHEHYIEDESGHRLCVRCDHTWWEDPL
ncbi:MAG TPA: hypothetical protein VFK41_06555 [Nocardioidaceae bacterium]|nr:hypothetical protein [Nocardioidaceae bacterium]